MTIYFSIVLAYEPRNYFFENQVNQMINLKIDALIRPMRRQVFSEVAAERSLQEEHVLIGVSPFNSYYSTELLTHLVAWGLRQFKEMHVFIPTKISAYTFEALGYPPNRARIKTKKQDSYLTNKVTHAFMENGFTKEEAKRKIVCIDSLRNNACYQEIHQHCLDAFQKDSEFREGCLKTSKWVLSSKEHHEALTEDALHQAVYYFLAELPLFINTPHILKTKSSLFVYKDMPNFLHTLYKKNELVSLNQGFLTINY